MMSFMPHTLLPLFFGYHKDDCHVTTCLLVERDAQNRAIRTLAKGVSICAEHDQFSRKRGREIAEGRAYKALKLANKFGVCDARSPFFMINRDEAAATLENSGHDKAYFKAIVNPEVIDFTLQEQKALNL